MNPVSQILAQSDWTLSVNWCSMIVQFGLFKLLGFVVLAVPLLLIGWMVFRLHALSTSALAGASAQSRLDPALGFVYEVAPADRDDLKQITGIGSVLEGKLHELGIFKFRQIAGWSDEVAGEFGKRLSFSDRVFREEWREQAAKLHAEKHGGAA